MPPVEPSLLALLGALERRLPEKVEAAPPDWALGLTAKQREVLLDTARTIVLKVGRRGGKTHVLCRLLLRAVSRPQTLALYIAKTRGNAKKLMWKWLKRDCERLGIKYTTNEAELVLSIQGGGDIILGGADDVGEIEKYRQFAWDLVVIDECGVYPPLLFETLVQDVIKPATMDHRAPIVYAGTPGYVMAGPWFKISHPPLSKFKVWEWTAQDNTAIPHLWEEMLREKEEQGWADDHPTWVREYLGKWVDDSGALVFPLDPQRNGAKALPRVNRTGVDIRPSDWRFVLGIDVGYVDKTAFSLVAAHPLLVERFTVHVEKHGEMLARQVATRIRTIRAEVAKRLGLEPRIIERCPIVMDTGGQGKPYAEECRRIYALPVEAAAKADKETAVRIMRSEILAGTLKVLDWEYCDGLREECAVVPWDDEKRLPSDDPSIEDDAIHATMYALRKLRMYRSADALPQEQRATDVGEEHLADLLRRQAQGKADRLGRPWYDQTRIRKHGQA